MCSSRTILVVDDDPNLRETLALILQQRGKEQEALPYFQAVLRQQPDNPEALNALGVSEARQGNVQAAAEYFARSLQQRPTFLDARRNLELLLVAAAAGAIGVPLEAVAAANIAKLEIGAGHASPY